MTWTQYGGNPQHTGISNNKAAPMNRILWQAPIDLHPVYNGTTLLIHYGTPLITPLDTVILMVKTGTNDGYRVEGRSLKDGHVIFQQDTDYSLPPHNWTPSVGSAVVGVMGLVTPAAGGTVLVRQLADTGSSPVSRVAFYGTGTYNKNVAAFNQNVKICTPITSDSLGNVYFGFRVFGANPANLTSGFARINASGVGSWVSAAAVSGDPNAPLPAMNATPALSNDGKTLYVAVNNGGFSGGYLAAIDAKTLAPKAKVLLKDPKSGASALVPDDGTASPMVGPDGDVFFGVLENPFGSNHARGWLTHWNGTLSQAKTFGAFGWDDTPSVVPSKAVKSYTGTSKYLLLTKYNNYAGVGGDGVNKVAILDPNTSAVETVSGVGAMKEILTVAGPTPDKDNQGSFPNAVREWCINAAAVDVNGRCAIVNNEDGKCYRWNFDTNKLSQVVTLTTGIGEAYTPTLISRHGQSIAMNNATIYVLGN